MVAYPKQRGVFEKELNGDQIKLFRRTINELFKEHGIRPCNRQGTMLIFQAAHARALTIGAPINLIYKYQNEFRQILDRIEKYAEKLRDKAEDIDDASLMREAKRREAARSG